MVAGLGYQSSPTGLRAFSNAASALLVPFATAHLKVGFLHGVSTWEST